MMFNKWIAYIRSDKDHTCTSTICREDRHFHIKSLPCHSGTSDFLQTNQESNLPSPTINKITFYQSQVGNKVCDERLIFIGRTSDQSDVQCCGIHIISSSSRNLECNDFYVPARKYKVCSHMIHCIYMYQSRWLSG